MRPTPAPRQGDAGGIPPAPGALTGVARGPRPPAVHGRAGRRRPCHPRGTAGQRLPPTGIRTPLGVPHTRPANARHRELARFGRSANWPDPLAPYPPSRRLTPPDFRRTSSRPHYAPLCAPFTPPMRRNRNPAPPAGNRHPRPRTPAPPPPAARNRWTEPSADRPSSPRRPRPERSATPVRDPPRGATAGGRSDTRAPRPRHHPSRPALRGISRHRRCPHADRAAARSGGPAGGPARRVRRRKAQAAGSRSWLSAAFRAGRPRLWLLGLGWGLRRSGGRGSRRGRLRRLRGAPRAWRAR